MDRSDDITIDKIQEYSKKRRSLRSNRGLYQSLYGIVVHNIIAIASYGYTQYIHPIDRGLWRDDEISFTKWKLNSKGFDVEHRGDPVSWEHFFSKLFGKPQEYLVVSWNWNTSSKKDRHYQWD